MALASSAGETLVLALLIRRGVWKTLPIFCVYVAWALISDISSYLLSSRLPYESYFRYYLVQFTVDSVLQFVVLVELAWSILRPVRKSLPKGTIYVVALLLAVAGLVIWPLAGITNLSGYGPHSTLLFHLQGTVSILQVVFFLVLSACSQLLSIGWRDRELQVATGLGFYSIISLIASVMHNHAATTDIVHVLDQAKIVSYLCTLSYWVFSFSTKEQERKEFSPQMQHLLLQMGGGARANRVALTEIHSKSSREKD
jgi:hypothetical protein